MKSFIKIISITAFVFAFIFLQKASAETFAPLPYDPPCVSAKYDLRYGSRDYYIFGNVMKLQVFLYKSGFMTYPPTGYFGPLTQEGLKKYQIDRNLKVSGVFDYWSRKSLAEETCAAEEIDVGDDISKMYQVYNPYYQNGYQNQGQTQPQYNNTENPAGLQSSNHCSAGFTLVFMNGDYRCQSQQTGSTQQNNPTQQQSTPTCPAGYTLVSIEGQWRCQAQQTNPTQPTNPTNPTNQPDSYSQNEGPTPTNQNNQNTGGWVCGINGQTYGNEQAYIAGCK